MITQVPGENLAPKIPEIKICDIVKQMINKRGEYPATRSFLRYIDERLGDVEYTLDPKGLHDKMTRVLHEFTHEVMTKPQYAGIRPKTTEIESWGISISLDIRNMLEDILPPDFCAAFVGMDVIEARTNDLQKTELIVGDELMKDMIGCAKKPGDEYKKAITTLFETGYFTQLIESSNHKKTMRLKKKKEVTEKE